MHMESLYVVKILLVSCVESPCRATTQYKLLQLLPTKVGANGTSNQDFLLLNFPKDTMDKEVVWLIGNYCDIVQKICIVKKRKLSAQQAAGLMRSRLLVLRNRAVVQPKIFNV